MQQPTLAVDWASLPIELARTRLAWPTVAPRRLGGVSAFGIAGTNAHVVLEQAPQSSPVAVQRELPRRPALLVLSARGPEALRALASRYAARARALASRDALDDLCWAAASRRTPLSHRAAFLGPDAAALAAQLEAFVEGDTTVAEGVVDVLPAAPALVVPGQGGQWVGMARDLLEREPAFRAALEACDAAAAPHLPCSIVAQLALDAGAPGYQLDRLEVIQPTLLALAIAYARWLQSVGIETGAVVGHSMGEVGAAHLAGVLGMEDTMRIICRRSRLMAQMRGQGGMAVVGLSMGQLQHRLEQTPGRAALLSVAASNGPASCVVSGETGALAACLAELEAAGIFARAVQVDVASHSAQMDGPAQALVAELAGLADGAAGAARSPLRPHAAMLPIYSTVLGRLAQGDEFDAAHWGRNLRQPVRFDTCIDALLQSGHRHFVELGPHAVLSGSVQQNADAHSGQAAGQTAGLVAGVVAIACGRRDEPGQTGLMAVVARLWTAGHSVDWEALLPRARAHVDLPLYPWQRERHWCEAANQRALGGTAQSGGGAEISSHPLLGRRFDPAGPEATNCWEAPIDLARLSYLADHVVRGTVLFPAAAYCEAALAAAAESGPGSRPGSRFGLRDVEFHAAWALPAPATRAAARLQVRLQWTGVDAASFEIHGLTPAATAGDGVDKENGAGAERWQRCASGRIVRLQDAGASALEAPTQASNEVDAQTLPGEDIYARLADGGLRYGPAFRGLSTLRLEAGSTQARAELQLDAATLGRDAARHLAYPPLLDAVLQVQAVALMQAGNAQADDAGGGAATPIPVRLAALDLFAPLSPQARYSVVLHAGRGAIDGSDADADLLDEQGRCIAMLRGSVFERMSAVATPHAATLDGLLYTPTWRPAAWLPAEQATSGAARAPRVILVAEAGADDRPNLDSAAIAGVAAAFGALGADDPTVLCLAARELDAAPTRERLARALRAAAPARGHIVHLGALACPSADAGLDWIERCWQRIGDDTVVLARHLAALEGVPPPRVWLVTRGAVHTGLEAPATPPALGQAALWGLGRVWAHEQPALDQTLVDLEGLLDADIGGESDLRDTAAALLPLLRHPPAERQLARRGKTWLAGGLVAHAVGEHDADGALSPNFTAALATPGTPDSLHWRAALRPAPRSNEIEIEVEHTGLNFMNLMSALGIYLGGQGGEDGQGPLGIECSGRVSRVGAGVTGVQAGDAVVAIGHGCLQRRALVPAELVAPRPRTLDATAAAGLPIAFLTAVYGLLQLARLERGERVLIHSAAGGVGLAALQVARRAGAEVFATAGTEDKRALLRSMGVGQVFDSRSTRFADEVLAATGGRGVDVVLNSLAGEAFAAGLRCLAPYGRFIELGKRDIYGGTEMALAPFRANLSYFAVDLDRMMRERPAVLGRLLREVMVAFDDGTYTALPVTTYAADQLVPAFRDLMPGTHVGKHVVAVKPGPARVAAAPGQRMPVHADGCYVVTGALGALGLEVARWLAQRGAGALMLIGRSAPTGTADVALADLAAQGTRVLTATCNVADTAALAQVLERARREGGPLRGVFHAAGVLADATLGAMTAATLRTPREAKVLGAWNLDRLTEGDALDAFVLFSSVASLFGTPGQGNYAAANAFLDGLAAHRHTRGKPVLSINLGPVADVGLAAASATRGDALARLGFGGLPAARVVEAIDVLVAAGTPQAACAVFDAHRWLAATAREGARGLIEPEAATMIDGTRGGAGAAPAEASLLATLAAVPAGPPRRTLLEDTIKAEVGAVLRLAAARVPTERALKTLGLDSLMALELRNRLEKRCAIPLSPTLAWNHPTVRALGTHLAERLQIALDAPAASPAELEALLQDLEQMSDEDARALLEQGAGG